MYEENYKINRLTCTFNDIHVEREFQENKWGKYKKYIRNLIFFGQLIFIPIMLDDIRLLGLQPIYIIIQILTIIACATLLISSKLRENYYAKYFTIFITLLMVNGSYHYYVSDATFPVGESSLPLLTLLFFTIYPIRLINCLFIVLVSVSGFILLLLHENQIQANQLPYLFVFPFVYGLFTKWNSETRERKSYISSQKLNEEKEKVEKLTKLEIERHTLEKEEARKFQMGMLPKESPSDLSLDISTHIHTADEVGGDYFDFYNTDSNSIFAVVGDATGHGMVAGNIVSITKAALNSLNFELPINEIVQKLNMIIKKVSIGRNRMSLNLCKITDNNFEICSAGMPPTYKYNSKNRTIEEILISGLPAGSIVKSKYKSEKFDFNSGDIIVMISDGLPECENSNGEILGYNKIKDTILSFSNESANAIKHSLIDLGNDWLGENKNQDDITFMIIKKN